MLAGKSNDLPGLYNRERRGENPVVPKTKQSILGVRRTLGTAALVWNLWRRLPSRQRRQALRLARKHGPRLAKRALEARRKAKRARR